MLKDITLGQYFPGDSVFHRMDPRTKLILVILYIVALFQATNFLSYAVMALVTVTVIKISQVPPKALVRGLKPIVIIIVLTAVLNLWGFIAGCVLILVLIVSNVTVNGKHSYLYPLIPFNGRALSRLFFRRRKDS